MEDKVLHFISGKFIEIIGYLTAGIILLISIFLKDWFKSLFLKWSAKSIETTVNDDALIYGRLGELLQEYNASRVWLAKMHNGVNFADGESFKKYSITHMYVDKGVSWPRGWPKDYQDVPISLANEILVPLFKDGIFYGEVRDLEDHGYFKRILTTNDVKFLITVVVRKKSKIIGFVGMTWTSLKERPYADLDKLKEVSIDFSEIIK